ncbi:glycosyltransferase [Planctomycetota bacterium]
MIKESGHCVLELAEIPAEEISDPNLLVKEPVVSVKMITYNHEQYIAQAIESVLEQKTEFSFELVIGEDCSTDRTREIVFDYQKKYPDIIRVITSGKNVGARKNSMRTLKARCGKYIALCEGDDYWTNPNKLQKQVDFLDANHDYVICFHWAGWLNQESGRIIHWKYGPPVIKSYYTEDDLLEHSNFIPTCSTVYRTKLFDKIPDWYYKVEIGDFPLHILNAQHGKIGFIDEPMAVYRRHKGGIHGGSAKTENLERLLRVYHIIGTNMDLDRRPSFRTGVSKHYANLCETYREEGKHVRALRAGLKSIAIAPRNHKKNAFVRVLSFLFPFLYKLYRLLRRSLAILKNEGVRAFLLKTKCRALRKSMSEDDM